MTALLLIAIVGYVMGMVALCGLAARMEER
jgi:hypothetical protein